MQLVTLQHWEEGNILDSTVLGWTGISVPAGRQQANRKSWNITFCFIAKCVSI